MFSTKTDTIEVIVAGQKVVVSEPLTVDKLISIAADNGIQKFDVYRNGLIVPRSAFPISDGVVEIREYNEAK